MEAALKEAVPHNIPLASHPVVSKHAVYFSDALYMLLQEVCSRFFALNDGTSFPEEDL